MADLIDMEILVERVRNASAKSYIQEAVNCYRAGAYRSCIVATWIALIYDFVDKFRDLALSGDGKAKTLVSEFERIQRERDTTAALKFEREVLDTARDEYELLSAQEQVDLKRLFEDRNRYGHPNINQDSEMLNATPELARMHLRNAVEHVMERPPVQGKVAMSTVQAAVDSPYFPRDAEEAVVALSSTPLMRAKRKVIKDFFLGCVISLLRERLSLDPFERRLSAAIACRRMHGEVVDEVIAEKLSEIFNKVLDDDLPYLLILITKMPELIARVSSALKLRLKGYIKQTPEKNLALLNFASKLDFLKPEVILRLESITPSQLRDFTQGAASNPSRLVINRALQMLETSKSWDSSNAISSAIAEKMLDSLVEADGERLLAAISNDEVKWSFNYPPLIRKAIESGLLEKGRVLEIARERGATTLIVALEEPLAGQ